MGKVLEFVKRFEARDPALLYRDVEPLEGTRMSLWNSQIPAFWQDTFGTPWMGNAQLAERVWVAFRCQQLNAQQIASMPLKWSEASDDPGAPSAPAWVSAPDPNWYPNGIGDALHAIVDQMYGWGFVCLFITSRYADFFPRTWTVLPSSAVQISMQDGRRRYKIGEDDVNPADIVQIDRDPGVGVKGCSALSAYAQQAWGLLAAGNQSLATSSGGTPKALLKPQKRTTQEQREEISAGWTARMAVRDPSAPVVIPEDLLYEQLSFNPSDLSLLETQEWNARVIATAYGVPATLLNMALQGGLTYQNPAALGEQWWRFELRPTATRIANALTAQMLPRGQFVWLDAADTVAPIMAPQSFEDDPQAAQDVTSQVAQASPAQQPDLTVIGGTR